MTMVSEPASFLQVRRAHPRATRDSVSASAVKSRVYVAMLAFACVYVAIAGRLVMLAQMEEAPSHAWISAQDSVAASRPDLIDRNGEILATDIKTASLYAEPRRIMDVDEAVEGLIRIVPDLNEGLVRRRLESGAGFVWLKREMTPQQAERVHNLGLPGIGFLSENQRFYPGGPTAGHIVGSVNVDNQGLAGIEKYIDDSWLRDLQSLGFTSDRTMEPVKLSVDLRVQHVVRDELVKAMERYKAIAAAGIVLDAKTGEVVAMSSLPDYDPNDRAQALEKDRLNRATGGVFEMGSVFKTFTTAMALDSGAVSINDSFDATRPIRAGGRTISDFHGKHRILSVPEIFIYSSNIGTAKMMLATGIARQQDFLKRLHLTDRLQTELPENAAPLLPPKWNELAAMTISFGHGISVTPMQTAVAAAALVNGGVLLPPTFLPRSPEDVQKLGKQVVSPETSRMMRYLFRLNVLSGSGRRADVPGYTVGGKTGTAEKIENGRYVNNKRRNSFLSAFPMDDPRYVVLVVIDEPKPERDGIGATAGLNAAPMVGAIVRRSAPMLGVMPRFSKGDEPIEISY
ncbi:MULTISPECIES: peptidoglycan D,D-transpeptidase FtsI family protein [Stappiaceae]|uniref:peptidoglycan D,D-transpeptidase FtsI family protein n=1 Tax=Stappiaceae TaxID=2821832 RepID=UPI00144800EB|nr:MULTISPECIES: penicillin-binding protein 2 [Stappiaceae]MEC9472004.1 penicillin-binding protein 2 [Pseudomonadota bacterium]NKX65714.1 penicillin-binding protein 2 [Labrenzia sp. 5N]UES39457.1 penicillin-binding protein 2 [Roseibium aggregatum]UES58816.1 penicillin-binding protein 2 [Roseibium aggregatum]